MQGPGRIHVPQWRAEQLAPPSPSTMSRKQEVVDGKEMQSPSVKMMRLHYILFTHIEMGKTWANPKQLDSTTIQFFQF